MRVNYKSYCVTFLKHQYLLLYRLEERGEFFRHATKKHCIRIIRKCFFLYCMRYAAVYMHKTRMCVQKNTVSKNQHMCVLVLYIYQNCFVIHIHFFCDIGGSIAQLVASPLFETSATQRVIEVRFTAAAKLICAFSANQKYRWLTLSIRTRDTGCVLNKDL